MTRSARFVDPIARQTFWASKVQFKFERLFFASCLLSGSILTYYVKKAYNSGKWILSFLLLSFEYYTLPVDILSFTLDLWIFFLITVYSNSWCRRSW